MAFLVQLVLPLYTNSGDPFDATEFIRVRRELTERFGGVTAYTRSPAEGTWKDPDGHTHRDDVVMVEVMAESLDREWWSSYTAELAKRLNQEELVVRAIAFEDLSILPSA